MKGNLKTNFRVCNQIKAFYTGGKVQVSSNGDHIFCTHGDSVNILDSQTGKLIHCIKDEGADEVSSFAVTRDDEILVVAYRNSLLKQWDWREGTCTRTWQSLQRGPVVSMAFDATSTLLATGSSDGTIKMWDIIRQYCTHNLKGSQGVVSLVQFHPDPKKLHLYSVSDDNHIRVWDLQTSRCTSVLETHYGAVTSLSFTADGQTLLSSGRDSVAVIWDLDKGQAKKTIPVFEPLEAVIVLPEDRDYPLIAGTEKDQDFYFLTAGASGIMKLWNSTGRCLYEQKDSPLQFTRKHSQDSSEDSEEPAIITDAVLCQETGCVAVVTYDHNIVMFGLEDLKLKKQFVGYNEEILDLRLMGKKETHLAVASNSEQVRVFELSTGGCQILTGHTDIVLALDVFKQGLMLISSSKDNTVRIWRMDADTCFVSCVAVGVGHTHSVGTVAAPRLSSSFCVSGSEDLTLKVWKLPEEFNEDGNKEPLHMKVSFTEKAHDKDINSVSISPNDKLLATGSQDRVAKLWHLEKEVLLGSFRGHRRGIWCVQFSPTDQALATSSADGSIKIWALTDFSCVKTFEGHDASVLKVIFLTRGMQLFSSGSDGLLKLWTIKSNECVATLDDHDDKVWSLTSDRSEQKIVTAGADSSILIWEDVTQIEYEEQAEKEEDQILKEQQLSNLMHSKKFTKALRLAIILDQPFKALGIIRTILEEPNGEDKLDATIAKLRPDQIASILKFAQTWNTNSKHCHAAQAVVSIVLQANDPEELAAMPGMKQTLEGLLPYTERHFQRLSRLVQQAMFVEYTWQVMRRAAGGQGTSTDVEMKMEESGIGAFVLDKTGDGKEEPGADDESSDDDEDDEEEEEEEEEGEDKIVEQERTNNKQKGKASRTNEPSKATTRANDIAKDTSPKTPVAMRDQHLKSDDDSGDEEEEEEKDEERPEEDIDSKMDDNTAKEQNGPQDEQSDLDEEKENVSTKSIVRSSKKRRTRSKLLSKKQDDEDDSDEDEAPTPMSRSTRRSAKSKTPVQVGRGSKRKSTSSSAGESNKNPAPAVASAKTSKKTPSPYTKKLRRPSRK